MRRLAEARPAELVRKGGVSLWLVGVGEVLLSCGGARNLLDRCGRRSKGLPGRAVAVGLYRGSGGTLPGLRRNLTKPVCVVSHRDWGIGDMLKIVNSVLAGVGVFKFYRWLKSSRGRRFLRGAKAVLYVALYLTFLGPAYVLTYYWVAAVFGTSAAEAPDPWDGMFLLLPICLLAPYVLTRLAGSRWLALLAALALILGLVPILGPPLSMEFCREPLLGWWRWLDGFCAASMVGWSSGVSAASAVLHLLVLARGAKSIMKAPEEEKRKVSEKEESEGQASADDDRPRQGFWRRVRSGAASKAGALKRRVMSGARNADIAGAAREGSRRVRKSAAALWRTVVGKRGKAVSATEAQGVEQGVSADEADAGSIWRRGAAWARKTAQRGAAGVSAGASALRREAGPRAAAAAQRGFRAGWRGIKGAAEKLKTVNLFKTAPGWRGLKDATKKRGDDAGESEAGP